MFTRCPHCQTTFRITAKHLQQAKGKVRCGHCQQVFNGRGHLVDSTQAQPKAKIPPKPSEHEFIDLSKPAPSVTTPPPQSAQAEDETGYTTANPRYNDLDSMAPIEVPGELNLDFDSEETETDADKISATGISQINVFDDEAEEERRASTNDDIAGISALLDDVDRQLQEPDILTDAVEEDVIILESEPAPVKPQITKQPQQQKQPIEEKKTQTETKPEKEQNKPVFIRDEKPALTDSIHKIKTADTIPYALRHNLAHKDKAKRSITATILYSFAGLILIGALLAQIVIFRSAQLVDNWPQLKPTLTQVCELAPCRYAGQRDVSAVELVNRDVRTHPSAEKALMISATIVNQASFQQPYPKMKVTLSDLSGNLMAQRIFTPKEYLDTFYHPFLLMQPATPVHINLTVVDPGEDAVNFEFQFL